MCCMNMNQPRCLEQVCCLTTVRKVEAVSAAVVLWATQHHWRWHSSMQQLMTVCPKATAQRSTVTCLRLCYRRLPHSPSDSCRNMAAAGSAPSCRHTSAASWHARCSRSGAPLVAGRSCRSCCSNCRLLTAGTCTTAVRVHCQLDEQLLWETK
jgi:hypothetical protein